ncbi:MAG: acetylornithine/succinylornithine family transaminase, partial [Pseudohongiellaceae bacterium]
ISGIAVCALGHRHPRFTRTLAGQADRLVHTSNLYGVPLQRQLAARLAAASGMENVFFCNSGAEANEAAIKLARMYGHQRDIQVPAIIVMEGAFHGRTMGALTATHNHRHQAGFGPLLEGFVRVPFDDVKAVEAAVRSNPDIVAVLLEPIQGEGGVRTCQDTYLQELRNICQRHDLLLMLDEVQTGNGRTGLHYAFQHAGILPDVLTTAKGLGNGFPIGACMARNKAAAVFKPGHHATTFGGSPLACAAALAVLDAIEEESLLENTRTMGAYLLQGFRKALAGCTQVVALRGSGLMIGIELATPCGELVDAARQRGVLINIAAGNVVRLLPPLILKQDEADIIVTEVSAVIREFCHGN